MHNSRVFFFLTFSDKLQLVDKGRFSDVSAYRHIYIDTHRSLQLSCRRQWINQVFLMMHHGWVWLTLWTTSLTSMCWKHSLILSLKNKTAKIRQNNFVVATNVYFPPKLHVCCVYHICVVVDLSTNVPVRISACYRLSLVWTCFLCFLLFSRDKCCLNELALENK